VCSDTMEGLPKIRPSVTKVGIGSSREAHTMQVHCSISDLISGRSSRLR